MTNIVERLRAAIPDCNDIKWRLLSDAAIEIERLRAEVADAVKAIDTLHEQRRVLEARNQEWLAANCPGGWIDALRMEVATLRALLLRWRDCAEDGAGSGELIAMTDAALTKEGT